MKRVAVAVGFYLLSLASVDANENEFRLKCMMTSILNLTTLESNSSIKLGLDVKLMFPDGDVGRMVNSVGNSWNVERSADKLIAKRSYDILGNENDELITIDRFTGQLQFMKWEVGNDHERWLYEGSCKKLDNPLF